MIRRRDRGAVCAVDHDLEFKVLTCPMEARGIMSERQQLLAAKLPCIESKGDIV